MSKNMLIGQSGGPTASINASLSGAVRTAMQHGDINGIYGALNGLEGILSRNIIDLRRSLRSTVDFDLLEATPAMALGSCRSRLPEGPDPIYPGILKIFRDYQIGYFFYIGGNDSMDTMKKLSSYFASVGENIRCVGIPKTIDNDLPCTDHTPGFGSAAKYIATSLAEIICDSEVYSTPSVTLVEIMGRNAGWLTAASVLARRNHCVAPHLIYLPEAPFDQELFLKKLREVGENVQNIVVAVSEGLRCADGAYVASKKQSGVVDAFGHRYLAGVGRFLEELVRERIGCKVRSVELNVLQRAASHCTSGTDIKEALETGAAAVRSAIAGDSGVMITARRLSNHPYLLVYESEKIEKIANQERRVPRDWITADGCDVTEEMTAYLKPLILGEPKTVLHDGMPVYFCVDKTPCRL